MRPPRKASGRAARRLARAKAARQPRPAPAPARAPAASTRVKTLDRALARTGAGSRTQAADWIRAGRVSVGGRVVKDPATWVDPERDEIALDGEALQAPEPVHIVLNKPKGVVVSRAEKGRRTVYDVLPKLDSFVFPVGRLDADTSGLLVVTNDSQLAERLMNPEFKVPKTYLVKASTSLTDEQLDRLRAGVELDDGPTRPALVTRLRNPGGRTVFEMTITEGRNRQVRRMVEAIGSKVLKLVRVSLGPLRLGDMQPGRWRELTPQELGALRKATGLRAD